MPSSDAFTNCPVNPDVQYISLWVASTNDQRADLNSWVITSAGASDVQLT
jgi:hypothetical protein